MNRQDPGQPVVDCRRFEINPEAPPLDEDAPGELDIDWAQTAPGPRTLPSGEDAAGELQQWVPDAHGPEPLHTDEDARGELDIDWAQTAPGPQTLASGEDAAGELQQWAPDTHCPEPLHTEEDAPGEPDVAWESGLPQVANTNDASGELESHRRWDHWELGFDPALSAHLSLGSAAAFDMQGPQAQAHRYYTSFSAPAGDLTSLPLGISNPSPALEPPYAGAGNGSTDTIPWKPWNEFLDSTLSNLKVVLMDESLIRARLSQLRSSMDPWPELFWDHDQIIPCRYGTSAVEWLRPVSIRGTNPCSCDRTTDCLILFRQKAVGGCRKNASLTVSCTDSMRFGLEPVTVCRPCYELSEGKLWRQACHLRLLSGDRGKIYWKDGHWRRTARGGGEGPNISAKDILPVCISHSDVRSWPLRAGEVLVPEFSQLQTIPLTDETGQPIPVIPVAALQQGGWDPQSQLEPSAWFGQEGGAAWLSESGPVRKITEQNFPHVFAVEHVGEDGSMKKINLHHLQTIYVDKRKFDSSTRGTTFSATNGTSHQPTISAVIVGRPGDGREVYEMSIPPDERCPMHHTRNCLLLVEQEYTHDLRGFAISAACFSSIPYRMRPVSRCKRCITEDDEPLPVHATHVYASSAALRWRNNGWTRNHDNDLVADGYVTAERFMPSCLSHSPRYASR